MVTLLVAAIAVLPRIPGLTPDGRAQERIRRDIELWRGMPEGEAKERLGRATETQVIELLDDRASVSQLQRCWVLSTSWLMVGWLALVASSAVNDDEPWKSSVRWLLQMVGLGMSALGMAFALACAVIAVRKLLPRWAKRRDGKRASSASSDLTEPA
jgi:hypothetical protein